MNETINHILPIICIIIGVVIQFFLSRKNEVQKQQNISKISSYTDFLTAIAGNTVAQQSDDKLQQLENRKLLSSARARIAIYGTDLVIQKLADFLRSGASLDNPESNKKFILLISAMRDDGLKSSLTNLNDLSQLILGSDMPNLSP